MKTFSLPALIALGFFLANPMFAAAGAPPNRVAAHSPAAATQPLPLAACAFNPPLGDSCFFEQPYTSRRADGGRFSRMVPAIRGAQARFAHEFDAGFDIRRRRLERCLAQKPSVYHDEQVAAWSLLPRFHYANPYPSSLGDPMSLSASPELLGYLSYCM